MASGNEPTHFYVTLLSNASQKLYPSNTLSSFKLHLAWPVDLGSNCRWEVGVCELTSRPTNVGAFGGVKFISASNALIYCVLISPQFFGTQYVMVLRTFIMPTTYCNHTFDNFYYMLVEKRCFHNIEIKIVRLDGTPVKFTESDVPLKVVNTFDAFPSGNN
jgi:hypothetical protein